MLIISYKNVFFGIAALMVVLAIASISIFGLHMSTEFTGGSLVEVRYAGERPAMSALDERLVNAGLSSVSIRSTDDNGYVIRAAALSTEAREALQGAVSMEGAGDATITRLSDIGPSMGAELRNKAFIALSIVLIAIVLFVAFAFRRVSKPISSWLYGLITIVTLVFDVIVPVGAFALFGFLWGAEVDTLFVTAVLTILGYSVHDTIVVFDRLRENLRLNQEANRKEDFDLVAGRSVDSTFVRSMNTSITTLGALIALFLLGPAATQDFALTLIVGVAAGTYSSIALAVPLLALVASRQTKS